MTATRTPDVNSDCDQTGPARFFPRRPSDLYNDVQPLWQLKLTSKWHWGVDRIFFLWLIQSLVHEMFINLVERENVGGSSNSYAHKPLVTTRSNTALGRMDVSAGQALKLERAPL